MGLECDETRPKGRPPTRGGNEVLGDSPKNDLGIGDTQDTEDTLGLSYSRIQEMRWTALSLWSF